MLALNVFFFSFISVAASANPPECLNGVNLALAEFTFASPTGELQSYAESSCSNTLFLNSLWAAAQLYCTTRDINYGERVLQESCAESGFVLPSYESVKGNITDAFIEGLPVVEYSDIALGQIHNTSILISKVLARSAIRTSAVFDTSVFNYKLYGWIILGLWGLVLLSGIANRFVHFILNTRQPTTSSQRAYCSHIYKTRNNPYHWIRTNVILPATFGTYRQRLWSGSTLPTRLEFLVLAVYYILTILLCSVSYEVFDPNLYYSYHQQIWRYFSDRTGAMAYANLPVLWLFAGRNNIFIWATGWKFSTFNMFHRHTARVTVILTIAHSVGYTILTLNEGDFTIYWKERWWVMGAVATVTMSLMLPFSSILLRKRSYELFLLMHIMLSLITIVGLFYHTRFYGSYDWDPYLWPVVAIWCFDRLARIVRWGYCNLHITLSKGLVTTQATAIYNEATDLIILNIVPGASHLKPTPGQHYFIYQYNSWRGWENHPFSLASWGQTPVVSDFESSTVMLEEVNKLDGEFGSPPSPIIESPLSTTDTQNLTFYIRPSTGFTGRLRKQCLNRSEPVSLELIFEGPYGHFFPSHTYDTLILVAGGSGIAGVLSYLRPYRKESRTSRVRLIWTTKQVAMVTEITKRELTRDLPSADFKRSFYVTGGNDRSEIRNNDLGLNIMTGRPDVRSLVSQEVRESGQRRTAVIACGPPGMADEARASVHTLLLEGFQSLEYVEESFGW